MGTRPSTIVGAVLIVVGVLILVLQGTSFTKKNVAGVDPAKLAQENEDVVPVLPMIGVVSLGGGIALVVLGSRR